MIDFGYDDDFRPMPGTLGMVRLRWLFAVLIFAFGALLACVPAR